LGASLWGKVVALCRGARFLVDSIMLAAAGALMLRLAKKPPRF
jgi:hypothetical protein